MFLLSIRPSLPSPPRWRQWQEWHIRACALRDSVISITSQSGPAPCPKFWSFRLVCTFSGTINLWHCLIWLWQMVCKTSCNWWVPGWDRRWSVPRQSLGKEGSPEHKRVGEAQGEPLWQKHGMTCCLRGCSWDASGLGGGIWAGGQGWVWLVGLPGGLQQDLQVTLHYGIKHRNKEFPSEVAHQSGAFTGNWLIN